MRLRISNKSLPDVWSEQIATIGTEIIRRAVYVGPDAATAMKVGEITYRARGEVQGGRVVTAYGWVPELVGGWDLRTKVDAANVVLDRALERATREGGAK